MKRYTQSITFDAASDSLAQEVRTVALETFCNVPAERYALVRTHLRKDHMPRNYTVTVSAEQVRYFNSTWPCSPIPEEQITFHFQGTDLVDIESETPSETFDGNALLALSYDAQKGYGTIRYE